MLHRTFLRLFLGIVIAVLVMAAPATVYAQGPDAPGDTPQPGSAVVFAYRSYLPAIVQPSPKYTGAITYKGAPVGFLKLDLYVTNDDWDTSYLYASTQTDVLGFFQFTNLPTVGGGTKFGVEWANLDDSYSKPYLSAWLCDDVENVITDTLNCAFDIVDVVLVAPSHKAYVSLPAAFSWKPRSFASDQYEVNWWDPDLGHYLWTDKLPSYNGSYLLYGIPDFFYTGFPYNWAVDVYGTNGVGMSYYYRWVTFNNHFSAPLEGASPTSALFADATGSIRSSQRFDRSNPEQAGVKPAVK